MNRVLLFDAMVGGHHEVYLQRTAEALLQDMTVVVAAPGFPVGLNGSAAEFFALEADRPGPRQLNIAIEKTNPAHAFHLYADPVLDELAHHPTFPVPVTLLVFYPLRHLPRAYGISLSVREWRRAMRRDRLIARWRARRDAHAVMTLDESAVARWRGTKGAPTYWFPEPPVALTGAPGASRRGCVLYGVMSRHKGLDLLVEALMIEPGRAPEVVLAGPVADEYRTEFDRQLSRLRTAGVQVTTRQWLHSEAGGLDVLARAGCVLLPYPRHGGMSRVLLEAAAVGTPIVANEYGLVGDLVRRHGLGAAVDCRDRVALHRALLEFSSGAAAERFAPGLSAFADRYSFPRFREAVQAPFAATPSSTVP